MAIPALPIEIVTAILISLEFRELLRCREVCTLFKNIVEGDVRAQYKIELAVAGMEDGPPSALTPSDRLAILRERQEAWRTLQWRSKHEYPMLVGGVWELYGGVLAQASGNRTLVFNQLPSVIRGIEEKEWRIEDVGMSIRDFGMDPTQDLLIIMEHHREGSTFECRVHLKSLATGASHPQAPKGGMLVHTPPGPGHYSYAIQTSEDLLGLLVICNEDDSVELLIWQWRTGTLRLHVKGANLPSFAFLTTRYVLLAAHPEIEPDEDNAIPTSGEAKILVVDLEAASNETVDLVDLDYLCAFHYPALNDHHDVIDVSIRSDPGPHWRPNPSLKVPFSVAREDRLIVVTLSIIRMHVHFSLISLVPSSTFRSAIASLSPGETRRDFEWTEWGPHGSRMFPAPSTHTAVWVCYVYGMQLALARRTGSRQVIITFDFNPLSIRRARCDPAGVQELENEKLVTAGTDLSDTGIFRERVCTELPHWLRVTQAIGGEGAEGEGHFDAAMLSEDSLIMVSSQFHIRKYRVLTF